MKGGGESERRWMVSEDASNQRSQMVLYMYLVKEGTFGEMESRRKSRARGAACEEGAC